MTGDACTEAVLPAILTDPSARLCAAYEHIAHTRMQGLPFLNPALRVETVGFQPWREFWLGVIVTPWMMNLMLLPREPEHWPTIEHGDRLHYRFPAGDYDFIMAHDETLGEYMMCSLFSPMEQFGDHETARQTAEFVLKALFEDDVPETSEEENQRPTMQEKLATPLSKREFLRGRFLNKGEEA